MPKTRIGKFLSVGYKLTFINYQFQITDYIVSSLGKVDERMLIISSSHSSTE